MIESVKHIIHGSNLRNGKWQGMVCYAARKKTLET